MDDEQTEEVMRRLRSILSEELGVGSETVIGGITRFVQERRQRKKDQQEEAEKQWQQSQEEAAKEAEQGQGKKVRLVGEEQSGDASAV